MGSRRVPGGDERDVGRAGRPRGGAAKERPAAGERPDGAVAAYILVHHLLLQPDVRHVRGELYPSPRPHLSYLRASKHGSRAQRRISSLPDHDLLL